MHHLMTILKNTIVQLLVAVVVGCLLGLVIGEALTPVVVVVKQITGQIIFFMVPLIILGFVASSIAALQGKVGRLLLSAFGLAYASSVCAAFLAAIVGQWAIPLLTINSGMESDVVVPEVAFSIQIPPVMSVMSALLLAILLGLGALWGRSQSLTALLQDFREVVLLLVRRVLVPILPLYIVSNFCLLSYQGLLGQLVVFLPVIVIAIVCHYVWLAVLYTTASLVTRKDGRQVLRYYGPAYMTAIGTMSSAATLGVALDCARRSPVLSRRTVDFAVPLLANIHLCGSVLTETFFVCVVSRLLYGALPEWSTLVVFIFLFGIFAVGAPGVPGGTVLASLGIVTGVLGFDDAGTALLIAVFALQDSFGTACNVTGDGALTLILERIGQSDNRENGGSEA